MGCDYYHITDILNKDYALHFSETNDDWHCLCIFPNNDISTSWEKEISLKRLKFLALLGAAVVLAHEGNLENSFLPNCVPLWIRDEIKKLVKK